MPPKRGRDDLDNPKGPKIRSLNYVGQQPAFLRNAMSALSGRGPSSAPAVGSDGRPAIPTRPDGEGSDGEEEDEDEWDMGKGDEAPQVVVLKEGKHLERDEVDRLREQAKSSGTSDPLHTADFSSSSTKNAGSLSFSSSTGSSSRTKPSGVGGTGDWSDVLKSAGAGSEVKKREGAEVEKGEKPPAAPTLTKEEKAKLKEKEEKKKKKEKKKDAKKIQMLSFEDE
ncbi:hypothetical protein JCM11251_007810 [Rhodosporidiobolus azoricus]